MTLQQVADLRAEGDALYAFLEAIPEEQWSWETPFKNRTIDWVVQHLHDADRWTVHSVTDPDDFRRWRDERMSGAGEEPETVARQGAAGAVAFLFQRSVRGAGSRGPGRAGTLVWAG